MIKHLLLNAVAVNLLLTFAMAGSTGKDSCYHDFVQIFGTCNTSSGKNYFNCLIDCKYAQCTASFALICAHLRSFACHLFVIMHSRLIVTHTL